MRFVSITMTIMVLNLNWVLIMIAAIIPMPPPAQHKNLMKLKQIVNHIQNPQLYSTAWANCIDIDIDIDSCTDVDKSSSSPSRLNRPVTNSDVQAGEIVALMPIQNISYDYDYGKGDADTDADGSNISMTIRVDLLEKEKYPYPCIRWDDYASKQSKFDAQSGSSSSSSRSISCLFVHSDDKLHEGWYGNLIPISSSTIENGKGNSNGNGNSANCMIVPLAGAAPFCAVVATQGISKGDAIIRYPQAKAEDQQDGEWWARSDDEERAFVQDVSDEYAHEIGELISFLDMACSCNESFPSRQHHSDGETGRKMSFHSINESYPKLEKIHSSPDIYAIENFLSAEQCKRVIQKASSNMQPCLVKNEDTGKVEPDKTRTSSNANIPRREVPTITQNILKLMKCDEEQIEILQVLRYEKGQEFKPHTDGFEGPTTACGFLQSGRIATIFCYLNDVVEGRGGGTTVFPQIDLEITPKVGLAIVHFPTSLELEEDMRTEHQGSPAVDEKWLLTSWIWKNFRADARYAESLLSTMSDDVI